MSLISSIENLPPHLASSVSAEEAAYIAQIKRQGLLPFGVTPHFASLAGPDRNDPIRRQFFPDPRELLPDHFALDDPLGEAHHRAAPRLVHQYRDRALLLAGGSCAGYCRYCFRRVWVSGGNCGGTSSGPQGFIGDDELLPILAYLRTHNEIREILVSGGDPLTATDDKLDRLFRQLREARPEALLRVCTRAPITNPVRLGPDTIALFRQYRPLRMAVHINHPRELSPEARAGLTACVNAEIPILVQTVLLRGINDNADPLTELFQTCTGLGLHPYYLFQLDLAPGTAHFRVPLKAGLALYRELQDRFGECRDSGDAGNGGAGSGLPAYAVDLPGGGGKIRLSEDVIAGIREEPGGKVYLLRGTDGRVWPYPAN
ncbi:KamA family radical SAM protein [Spirochaetia bacterium]|nr:KamA family radical SAM protein [Spirochaetia bacterium]